jgi:hypothetical protein
MHIRETCDTMLSVGVLVSLAPMARCMLRTNAQRCTAKQCTLLGSGPIVSMCTICTHACHAAGGHLHLLGCNLGEARQPSAPLHATLVVQAEAGPAGQPGGEGSETSVALCVCCTHWRCLRLLSPGPCLLRCFSVGGEMAVLGHASSEVTITLCCPSSWRAAQAQSAEPPC